MRKYRASPDIEFPNPAICYCSSDAPDADPLIGQAAASNAALSKEMVGVAKDQLQWNKDRAAISDPLTQKIAQQQIATADTNTARSADQWDSYTKLFKPVEAQMVNDATNWDSTERKNQMAAEAGADVTNSYQAASDTSARQMQAMGINPNSGRYAALNNEATLSQAKDTAGAMNKARRDTEQQGVALRTGVAQFGRGLPSTGVAADSVALNAGNAANSGLAQSAAVYNAGSNTAANWYGGATGANTAAGNLALGQYGQQINAWGQDQQQKASSMQGIGQIAGMAGMAALMMRRGGIIGKPRNFRMNKPSYRSGLQAIRRGGTGGGGMSPMQRLAEGGMIDAGVDHGYGLRQDGTNKGLGWLGVHKGASGNDMSEYTVGVPVHGKQMDIPTFVPGLTDAELEHLKTEPDLRQRTPMNDAIVGKAAAHAENQVSQGRSVFAPEKKNYRAGGLLRRSGYAMGGVVDPDAPPPQGGMVSGPGTGTSDSVPGLVDGVQPIQVSNGEAVLNAKAVELVGEDFVHRINAGGLAMLNQQQPQQQPMEEQP